METDKKELLENLTDEELKKEMARRNCVESEKRNAKLSADQKVRHKAELIAVGVIDENIGREDLIEKLHIMYTSNQLNDHLYNKAMDDLYELKKILNVIPKRTILKAKRKLLEVDINRETAK